jgi:hypothetical protein
MVLSLDVVLRVLFSHYQSDFCRSRRENHNMGGYVGIAPSRAESGFPNIGFPHGLDMALKLLHCWTNS